MMQPKAIRQRAGRSRAWVAVKAGVSEPTARLYEIDPDAIESKTKRAALAAVYEGLDRASDAGNRPERIDSILARSLGRIGGGGDV